MAQKIITIYTDDLTGEQSEDASTHSIAIDGVAYEIDLGPDSYDKLLEAVGPFLKAGRRQGRAKGASGVRKAKPTDGGDTAKVRAWAKANGHKVNDRGRISAEIYHWYRAANG
ncbi:Lsr2 family protein [Streptomyces sp. NPDC045369]|uniref:histone-like nucleoid-structuring protein Lsr2 n=1 Tax=Streptomyces sp. NPDC045369 TaxID=3155732 RepID=UPI0033FB959B